MKYWDSIDDLPIYYYNKVIEEKSFEPLVYEDSKKFTVSKRLILLSKAWDKIELELYGLHLQDPKYIERLKDEARHYNKKIKAAISGKTVDRIHYENSKRIFEPENAKPLNFWDAIVMLQKSGINIDPKKYSVRLYYTAINQMKKEAEAINKARSKGKKKR